MKFMLIAKADKNYEAGVPPRPELMAAIGTLSEKWAKEGVLLETGGLLPTSKGARLRLSGGKVEVTDGPFSEAKEVIGGWAMVRVNSKAEAIELAKIFLDVHAEVLGPSHEMHAEVRQAMEFEPQGSTR